MSLDRSHPKSHQTALAPRTENAAGGNVTRSTTPPTLLRGIARTAVFSSLTFAGTRAGQPLGTGSPRIRRSIDPNGRRVR